MRNAEVEGSIPLPSTTPSDPVGADPEPERVREDGRAHSAADAPSERGRPGCREGGAKPPA